MAAERGGLMPGLAGGDPARVDSRAAVAAARRGDAVALELFERAGTWIGLGIVNVMSILRPEAIVIGGGLASEFDLFEPAMRRTVDRANVMIPAKDVKISPSGLGRTGGMLGAAYATFLEFGTAKG
jgi:glucokinase